MQVDDTVTEKKGNTMRFSIGIDTLYYHTCASILTLYIYHQLQHAP